MCFINNYYFSKADIKNKRKEKRDKRRALQELSMKQDIKDLEKRGRQDALHRLLLAHLELLCSLNMINEVRGI